MNKKTLQSGFSLVEILVVATIISLLAGIAIANYSSTTRNSRDARRKSDMESLRSALEIYRSQNGTYVANNNSWVNVNTLSALTTGGFINALPVDPKPNTTTPYQYKAVNSNTGYCLAAVMENAGNGITTQCTVATVNPNASYNYVIRNP